MRPFAGRCQYSIHLPWSTGLISNVFLKFPPSSVLTHIGEQVLQPTVAKNRGTGAREMGEFQGESGFLSCAREKKIV